MSHGCGLPLAGSHVCFHICVAALCYPHPSGVPGSHVCPHISRHQQAFLKRKNLLLHQAGQGVLPICLFKMAIWGEKEESMGEERGWGWGEKFSPQCGERRGFEEEREEGEHYGPMAATGRSSPSLGHVATAIRGDFNVVPCLCWHVTVCVPQPPLSLWPPAEKLAARAQVAQVVPSAFSL
jgi:hypothetical protein